MKKLISPLLFVLAGLALWSVRSGGVLSRGYELLSTDMLVGSGRSPESTVMELSPVEAIPEPQSDVVLLPPLPEPSPPEAGEGAAGRPTPIEPVTESPDSPQPILTVEEPPWTVSGDSAYLAASQAQQAWENRHADMTFMFRAGVSGIVLLVSLLMGVFGRDEGSRRWAFGMVGTVLGFWLR